jgi:hypothetical protein
MENNRKWATTSKSSIHSSEAIFESGVITIGHDLDKK